MYIFAGLRVADKCKFFLPEYAMFQKLAHANNRYFLPYFLRMIDEFKRREAAGLWKIISCSNWLHYLRRNNLATPDVKIRIKMTVESENII